jgi:hypothetical protein
LDTHFICVLPRFLRQIANLTLEPYRHVILKACAGAIAITGITPAFENWGLSRAGRQRSGPDRGEFDAILQAPPKKATDYPGHHFFFHRMLRMKNVFRHIATRP